MAIGTLLVCPNCSKTFARTLREHFCSDHCRFWHKVEKTDKCWLWKGTTPSFGHGQFVFNGSVIYAHRFAWEEKFGQVTGDLCILHKCDVPSCVNPDHLFIGTREENLRDMRIKGRGCNPPRLPGSKHPQAKLTEQIVREIRASSEDQLTLSRTYGVCRRTINSIINRRTWSHVK